VPVRQSLLDTQEKGSLLFFHRSVLRKPGSCSAAAGVRQGQSLARGSIFAPYSPWGHNFRLGINLAYKGTLMADAFGRLSGIPERDLPNPGAAMPAQGRSMNPGGGRLLDRHGRVASRAHVLHSFRFEREAVLGRQGCQGSGTPCAAGSGEEAMRWGRESPAPEEDRGKGVTP